MATRRPWFVSFLMAVTMAACDGSPAAPSASNQPPAAPGAPLPWPTGTGTVWLASPTAQEPLSGVIVHIWLERPGSAWRPGPLVTDAGGRFSFAAPTDALVRLYAQPQGLFQPCTSTLRAGETEAAIRLVAESHLVEVRDWPGFAIERRVAGTIFEASPAGRVPVADAWIQVDGVMGDGLPLADTRSDAHGRFLLCGLEEETDRSHAIVVSKTGYGVATAPLPTQGEGPVDIELRRIPGG